jgi:hypothetical protein
LPQQESDFAFFKKPPLCGSLLRFQPAHHFTESLVQKDRKQLECVSRVRFLVRQPGDSQSCRQRCLAQALDSIRLFQQLEQLQQAVFRCAASCSPFVPNTPPAPIRIFSVETCTAGNVPAERSVPDPAAFRTLYREQERRKRVLGWRHTHKDPFEGDWEQIFSWLQANPERSSGDIFRELQRRSPGRYQPLQIRTLQRGMRKIRASLLETREEQWQAEVICGPSPAPVSAEGPPAYYDIAT